MYMRQEMRRFLVHQYTRIAREQVATEDAWGQQTYEFAAPVFNVPCFYDIQEKAVITAKGVTTLETTVLYLAYDDSSLEGDMVQNITTADGIVLLQGPVVLEDVRLRDPAINGGLFIQATLREVEYVPNPRE